MNIVTSFDHPPIPYRGADWSAIDEDTYDCDGHVGRGSTKEAAIVDLLVRLDPSCEVVAKELGRIGYSRAQITNLMMKGELA